MLAIQAAGQRGAELLAEALNRLTNALGTGLAALAIGASIWWHWLHLEWPASLLSTY